jgi:hypothetical protein
VPLLRVVLTIKGPGNMHFTRPAAVMPPSSCAGRRSRPRNQGRLLVMTRPSVTYLEYQCLLNLQLCPVYMCNTACAIWMWFASTRTSKKG